MATDDLTSKRQACDHPKFYTADKFGQPEAWGPCPLCERDHLLQRIEFAATALGVVERRRDELRDERDALLADIAHLKRPNWIRRRKRRESASQPKAIE